MEEENTSKYREPETAKETTRGHLAQAAASPVGGEGVGPVEEQLVARLERRQVERELHVAWGLGRGAWLSAALEFGGSRVV